MSRQARRGKSQNKYFITSLLCHVGILSLLVLGFDFTSPLPVIVNTSQHDVISAVVLGDSPNSKIIKEQPVTPPQPVAQPRQADPKPTPPPAAKKPAPDPDVIALAAAKKKQAEEQVAAKKKQRELLTHNLMNDILKESKKQKQIKQKALANQFKKMLHEQAEQTLRQQLLNESIKLKGTQTRLAQGVVDKYKALIIQAISENWVIPIQANKKLYSVLLIRVAPGGMVLDVQITQSSGDPSLDSSARAAVMKASPLPVPSEAAAFEPFRQFALKVKPENVMTNDAY